MREIVTGVDQAEQSEHVLAHALSEAETTARPVRVVHAWADPVWVAGPAGMGFESLPPMQDSARWAQEAAEALLDKALLQRTSTRPVTISAHAVRGDPGDVLVQAGADAGLVVVGGRTHGGVLSTLLGSATGYVLHHSAGPVMVVPDTCAPGPYRRVVVGFDDEACSRAALRWALDAARRHRCPVLVVHALRLTPSPVPVAADLSRPDDESELGAWLDSEVAKAKHGLDDVTTSCAVRDGSAAAVLLAAAGPADLLVLGSRGRGGFASLVLGSVATQCAQHAEGVVVVVRAGAERLDDPA